MKKALLFLVALALACLLTNPRLAAHKEELLEHQMEGLPAAGLDASSPVVAEHIQRVVERRTGRKDYWLFSLTTVNYSDTLKDAPEDLMNRTVGIGILGRVYLWSGM